MPDPLPFAPQLTSKISSVGPPAALIVQLGRRYRLIMPARGRRPHDAGSSKGAVNSRLHHTGGFQRGLQIWPCPNAIPSATSANFSKTAISFGLPQVAATKDTCRGRYRACYKPRAVRSEALVIARGARCTRAGAKKEK